MNLKKPEGEQLDKEVGRYERFDLEVSLCIKNKPTISSFTKANIRM